MEVILLQRIAKLGQMGDTVRVKNGYARNFLLPTGKALRATEANKKRFKDQKRRARSAQSQLKSEARPSPRSSTARASSSSVRPAKPASSMARSRRVTSPRRSSAGGFTVGRNQVVLIDADQDARPARRAVHLHPEVEAKITINVARSPEEAERQTKGEAINVVEETSMEDLGLEVGAALAEAAGEEG